MNTPQFEITSEIKFYLGLSKHPHLSDCMEMVAETNQAALYNMISDMQHNKVPKAVIALQVSEDIAAIVEGHPENAKFSAQYLNQ